ncbi:GNAT family N-acetyltransferase [Lapidilactobacillus gannanensis]|uniref:GNAT family N-acetyltransferase n=1 Tax=Lapidilactobacillus gannanensis TaxID=2486002 RepID=A0ABW4BPC3_9LACO|nr:GNAT family N-acetyltransferase [Lapidilactobacillus gannanensis]
MVEVVSLTTPTASELDQLMKIWLAGNLAAHNFVSPDYWLSHQDQVRELLSTSQLMVAKHNQEIVGFLGYLPESHEVAGLFVAHDWQHQGIGQQLMATLKARKPVLVLYAYERNQGACQFYQQQGFRITRRQLDETVGQVELEFSWSANY